MRAYASASGGVMFVPDEVERTIPKVLKRTSNDNRGRLLTKDALEEDEE